MTASTMRLFSGGGKTILDADKHDAASNCLREPLGQCLADRAPSPRLSAGLPVELLLGADSTAHVRAGSAGSFRDLRARA
jgi:hypothetical protein